MRVLFLLALLAQSPKELAEQHFDHAYELLGKKLYVKAIDQFLYVLALDPSHHDAHFYAGLAFIQRGLTGLEQADHHLSRAIELDPKNPRQFHYRGLVLEFDLGEATSADELEIRWPADAHRVLHRIAADQRILVVEAKPGYEQLP